MRKHKKNRGWDKYHSNPEKASKIRKEEQTYPFPSYANEEMKKP